jgi:hypothetical protein
MADNNLQDTGKLITNTFVKGLNKDSDPSYVSEGMWTHAVNATNNTVEGDVGSLSNEVSNYLCATAGETMPVNIVERFIIGAIYLFSDKWAIFTAGHNALGNPVMSEIGLLEEDRCIYRPIVQDICLRFDKRYLISGASREKEDCSWQVYWADGKNPDRYLNIGDPKTWPPSNFTWLGGGASSMNYYSNGTQQMLWPGVAWNQDCDIINNCEFCEDTNSLNCIQTRLARLMETPCLKLKLGTQGGTLANGTYFAVIAYTIKGQKVTDYFSQSNNQFIYTVNDLEGSLDLEVSADTVNFDEFELVIVQNINQGTVAKRMGIYSTSTTRVTIDQIDPTNITVPIEQIPIQTPVYEKSDQISEVNEYLLRVGPTSKFDFNYQPLANLIRAKWASVEYPAEYYMKGGNKTNYLRDEVYCFFIRWVYDTGDKSSSYHIPGRYPRNFVVPTTGATVAEIQTLPSNANTLNSDEQVFEIYNTASTLSSSLLGTTTDDGGVVIATGEMGYWESSESYPDNRPDIWNASNYCWTGVPINPATGLPAQNTNYDLCGQNIRHHKFPENFINNNTTTNVVHFRPNPNSSTTGSQNFIRLLGVFFENIILPKDNDGEDIPGIAGFEILRGTREGNKTIIAKGIVNNFRTYEIRGGARRGRTGLYANYPFNTIVPLNNQMGNTAGHNYGFNDPYIKNENASGNFSNQKIPKDIFTFHSPDTMFRTPFLSTSEFKLYGHLYGYASQQFVFPEKHPKFKLLSNLAIIPMIVTGVAEAIISLIGKRTLNQPEALSGGITSGATPGVADAALAAQIAANATLAGGAAAYNTFTATYYSSGNALADALLVPILGYSGTTMAVADQALAGAINIAAATGATAPATINGTIELPDFAYLDPVTRVLGAINQIAYYFSEGAEIALRVIYAVTSYKQYALQHMAHGFYDNMRTNATTDIARFKIEDSFYIRDNIQDVSRYQTNTGVWNSYLINNLKRSDAVVVRTVNGANVTDGPNLLGVPLNASGFPIGNQLTGYDKSLVTLGTIQQSVFTMTPFAGGIFSSGGRPDFTKPETSFGLPIASHYASLKGRVRNQYGQLDSVRQIVITPCEQKLSDYSLLNIGPFVCGGIEYTQKKVSITPVLFGGDTYINRYTEKNNMMFFYDWLYDQPDGFEYNYFLRNMIASSRFSINSVLYEVGNLSEAFNFSSIGAPSVGTGAYPGEFYNLDFYVNITRRYDYNIDDNIGPLGPAPFNNIFDGYRGLFSVKQAYFYLTNSSIRDFFVESDVLIDFRQEGITQGEKHYDPYRYTDYISMFSNNPNVMGVNSTYIYDYSLSVSKLYNQYFSAGNLQSRYYDPNVSELCYTYYPDRVIYSLPQQIEAIKDSWFVYLINNYKEFKSQISGVKSINKSGIIITFKNDSPVMYQGVDTLETDLGTKITIGDGGLFSQPVQSVSNADKPYEYGSSQNRLSVISTPVGIFYISQNQGKIFNYGQGLTEISQAGLKWWFTLYLPYKLTIDFPDYPFQDNPVAGIGCQSVYDNTSSLLYFCKKDYKLRDQYKGLVSYVPVTAKGAGDYFTLDSNPGSRYKLGDPDIFENASWTVSYDPKNQFFISFHDWHPDLLIPTKDTFLSTKLNGMWKHNFLCNDFCQFYGQRYPFEVEIPIITGQTVMTTRSIEYILECYRRSSASCIDQHHVLDYNFDQAIVYNSEQVSGYLNLNLFPKNNITLSLQYPKLNANLSSYDILFSKEENKYRFNQFWDITRDRAEFPIGSDYPPTGPVIPGSTILQGNYDSQNTWVTGPDGYNRILNPTNMDYNKDLLQRKKFRHYLNYLNLRRNISSDINMILKIVNSKNQYSPR